MRHIERDLAVAVADRQIGDVDAGLEARPVRRELADAKVGVDLRGNELLDARTDVVHARQHDVAQSEQQHADDEIQDERDDRQHVERVAQNRMMVVLAPRLCSLAGMSRSRRAGGIVSLGHAAAGGVW